MSIQQNINQLLTMAGSAAMLSPQLRQKAEDRKALKALEKETTEYEAGVNALRESKNEQFKETLKNVSPLIRKLESADLDNLSSEEISGYLDKLKETEHLWDPENERYKAEEEFYKKSRRELDKKKLHLLEEKARIQPTSENVKALQKEKQVQAGAYYLDKNAKNLPQEELFKELEPAARSKSYRIEEGKEAPRGPAKGQEKLITARASLQKQQEAMQHMQSGGQALLEQREAFRDLISKIGGK
jgi:hypothetical protein